VFLFNYMESLTAAIRHPDTVGWVGRLRASCSCAGSA